MLSRMLSRRVAETEAAEHQKKRSSTCISIEDLPEKSILQPRHRMLDMVNILVYLKWPRRRREKNLLRKCSGQYFSVPKIASPEARRITPAPGS